MALLLPIAIEDTLIAEAQEQPLHPARWNQAAAMGQVSGPA